MNTRTVTTTTSDNKKGSAGTTPAKKKKPSLLDTVSSLRMRIRNLVLLNCIVVVVMTLIVLGVASIRDGSAKTVVTKLDEMVSTTHAEHEKDRTLFTNKTDELKGAIGAASQANVEATLASANSINATLETERQKTEQAVINLQSATTEGLARVADGVKKNGEAFEANAGKVEAMLAETARKQAEIAKLEAELALARVNPTTVATETPAADDKTHNVVLSAVSSGAPRAHARSLEKKGRITDGWKDVPAGVVFYCSPQDIVSRRVEVDDSSGLIAMSFTGWPSRKFLGRYPVGDTVPVVDGARSVGLMHPTRTWKVKVN